MWVGSTPEEPQAARWATWLSNRRRNSGRRRHPRTTRRASWLNWPNSSRYGAAFETDRPALDWATLDGLFSSWYTIASLRLFEYRLDTNAPRAARAYALLAVTHYDATIACWDTQVHYWGGAAVTSTRRCPRCCRRPRIRPTSPAIPPVGGGGGDAGVPVSA
ncbi:MAG: hypothetical protein U0531_11505 [Dehalococcoidia bacterium]